MVKPLAGPFKSFTAFTKLTEQDPVYEVQLPQSIFNSKRSGAFNSFLFRGGAAACAQAQICPPWVSLCLIYKETVSLL